MYVCKLPMYMRVCVSVYMGVRMWFLCMSIYWFLLSLCLPGCATPCLSLCIFICTLHVCMYEW